MRARIRPGITAAALAALLVTAPATANAASQTGPANATALSASTSVASEAEAAALSGVAVTRLSGTDRYSTAIAISKRAFPGTAGTVFVATGDNYPDALSAGPAAAALGGPLLLTPGAALPTTVRAEIIRLAPQRIVIAGGTSVVSAKVESALRAIAPVTRVSGTDRFETSRAIAEYAFPAGSPTVYVATGMNFPDALSAGAAAGTIDGPVLLVNGGASTATAAEKSLVGKLKATRVKIAGGAAAVSNGIKSSLTSSTVATSRLSGVDRFATAVAVNKDAHSTSTTAYLSTGYNFPDALAGTAVAGATGSPLFVIPQSCVPQSALDEITVLGVEEVVVLGGESVLGTQVMKLISCDPAAPESAGWSTVYREDFNAPAGTALPSEWVHEVGIGWGTGAIEQTTNSIRNTFHNGKGHLEIKAIRDANGGWTSGRVVTKRKDFEAPAGGQLMMTASIKQPNPTNSSGYWPAFWALGADREGRINWPSLGEIDMLENVNGGNRVFQSFHCGWEGGGPCNEPSGLTSGIMPCDGCLTSFHTYSAIQDRTVAGDEKLHFLIDGVIRHTVTQRQVGTSAWAQTVDHGYLMILNLSMGGAFPNGECGCDSVARGQDPTASMLIDHVAVYTKPGR